MGAFEPGISREVVASVAVALRALGFDGRELRAVSGDERVVPGALADRLLDAAATRLADDALAVTLAQKLPIGALGLLDYALCTSSTLRDALDRVTEHYALVSQRVKVRLIEGDGIASLVFTRDARVTHSKHWLELSMAIIAARMRQTLIPDIALAKVAFAHEPPKHTRSHDAYFGCKVVFRAPEDVMAFDAALLGLPLKTASASLASLLDAKMRELSPKDAGDAFLGRVRSEMVSLLDERNVQLDAIAVRLHLTRRTLQRELARRKTSHQAILDDVRRERALALLGESLTINEVAQRLAYSKPSAFFSDQSAIPL